MGTFYGSIHVKNTQREAVKRALEIVTRKKGRKCLLGPLLNGWIAIYPEGAGQDFHFSTALSNHLKSEILHLVVHDDDIFSYQFFRGGKLLNEYSSCPDYFKEVSAAEHKRLRAKPERFKELFCATSNGIRVFAWDAVLTAADVTPEPVLAIPPARKIKSWFDTGNADNCIYDMGLDESRNTLLFGGREGKVRFLNLASGRSGVLLEPPEPSPIIGLALSANKKALGCNIGPKREGRNHSTCRIQIWNYPALCRAAGLE